MRVTIDRISKEAAICEDENGEIMKLLTAQLPEGAAEGDILSDEKGGWSIDEEETQKRRNKIRERLKRLIE